MELCNAFVSLMDPRRDLFMGCLKPLFDMAVPGG